MLKEANIDLMVDFDLVLDTLNQTLSLYADFHLY